MVPAVVRVHLLGSRIGNMIMKADLNKQMALCLAAKDFTTHGYQFYDSTGAHGSHILSDLLVDLLSYARDGAPLYDHLASTSCKQDFPCTFQG